MKTPVFLEQTGLEDRPAPGDPVIADDKILSDMPAAELETEIDIVGEHIEHARLAAASLKHQRRIMQARHRQELEALGESANEAAGLITRLEKLRQRLYFLRSQARFNERKKP